MWKCIKTLICLYILWHLAGFLLVVLFVTAAANAN